MRELIRKILEPFLAIFQKKDKKKINLADYPKPGIDYGMLNSEQAVAMDNILAACAAGEETAELPVLTHAEFEEIVTHLEMHFGTSFRFDKATTFKDIVSKRQNTATVHLEVYERAKEDKAKLDAWIDNAIAQMNEGTTEDKLAQIAKCIADNAKYECPSNNPLDLLDDGGMCGAYSMLFYKMATRIGVQAYICRGEASNGRYTSSHAWNMVEIGERTYFYDVTWYDSFPRQPKYIHSDTPWDREYTLNNRTIRKTNTSA